jgi:uncharacterized peroxidase-related enzyme
MTTPEYELLNTNQISPKISAANLPIVSEDNAPPEVEALYSRFRLESGRSNVPGILQCFATHPPLLDHMMGLAEAMLFSNGALGREQKELLATFVSSGNKCEYCADSHGFFLRVHGGSEEALQAALTCDLHSSALTPHIQAWLSFIAKVSDHSNTITPTDVDALRQDGWTDLQIAETIHLTALFATFNRVVNAFGLSSQSLLATFERKNTEHTA